MSVHGEAQVEAEPATEQAAVQPPGAAPGAIAWGAPARVLALQRTAGNRAVGRLLRATGTGSRPRSAPTGRVLQRRRLPGSSDIKDLLSDPGAGGGPRTASADSAAFEAGMNRLWRLVFEQLTDTEDKDLRAQFWYGMTRAQFDALSAPDKAAKQTQANAAVAALPRWEREARWSDALKKVKPGLLLGDPKLINTGPRSGTTDAANITKLTTNANAVFDTIAAGTADADIVRVFGAANKVTAKQKYAKARTAMNTLKGADKVLTDRSGYTDEVSLGGLTDDKQIALSPDTIDNPDQRESVITMIHESMHAGNFGDVGDEGVYINRVGEFPISPVSEKLQNAAHFEVVPRRLLPKDSAGDPDDKFAYGGCKGCDPANPAQTFTPAGSSAPGGAATPAATPRQQALKKAYKMFKEAWTLGLNLHDVFVAAYKSPADWNTLDLSTRFGGVPAGTHYADVLPFWSKVYKMTIHERTHINPTGAEASTKPVTLIDVALSEGVTRKLSKGMGWMPENRRTFEQAAVAAKEITAAELTAATATVDGERDLLIKLVLKKLGEPITGSTDRDIRMTNRMATAGDKWADILKRRAPADFPGLTARAALAVFLLAVTACGGGGADRRIEPTDPAGCGAMFRERASGRRMTLTGSFPERVSASRRSTFDGTVTIANPGDQRLEALPASQPDVYVTQSGRIVATPVPTDAVGLVVDLAPGKARDLSATGQRSPLPGRTAAAARALRGARRPPLHHRRRRRARMAVGGPWQLEIA